MRISLSRLFYYLCLFVLAGVVDFGHCQNQLPVSESQALTLAQQSLAALTSGVPVIDVAMTGTATWIAGSDNEIGPAILQVKGTAESRIDLNLNGGSRTEIRNDSGAAPQGESVLPDGTVLSWPLHNCRINASWFFPALSALASTSDPSLIFTYVGPEIRESTSVQHIRVYRYVSGQRPLLTALMQAVSTEDIYLDSASLLPHAFTFNTHPDDDAMTDILIEIDFSNYQNVNGIQVPMRVQKLISGGLALDLVITNAVVNSGISDAPFTIH
jgi:hypothetical protein